MYKMYRNNESVSPNPRNPLEDYTLYIVDIQEGRLCDKINFKTDKIFLSHNQGLYLNKDALAVLSVQHQTVHIFHNSSISSPLSRHCAPSLSHASHLRYYNIHDENTLTRVNIFSRIKKY